MTIDNAFRARLFSRLVIDTETGCLLWIGAKTPKGYGRITLDKRSREVHRVMWEIFEGPIPEGHHLDHVKERGCVHRNCANVAHLEPVTPAENNIRSTSPTALNARKTECSKGHPFDEANTYLMPDGGRSCQTCRREARRRFRDKRRLILARRAEATQEGVR